MNRWPLLKEARSKAIHAGATLAPIGRGLVRDCSKDGSIQDSRYSTCSCHRGSAKHCLLTFGASCAVDQPHLLARGSVASGMGRFCGALHVAVSRVQSALQSCKHAISTTWQCFFCRFEGHSSYSRCRDIILPETWNLRCGTEPANGALVQPET